MRSNKSERFCVECTHWERGGCKRFGLLRGYRARICGFFVRAVAHR